MKKKKNILVLGGGGCRGFAQAQVLKKLEKEFGNLYERYSLIVGTSVGSINAGLIASGRITAERLEQIYPSMIKKVFEKKWYPRVPRYDRKNFYGVWLDEIGNIKMKECLTKLQITSFNICDQRNHFFKSWTKDGEQYLMSEVAKSFAAPLYFDKLVDERNKCVWLDGGVGCANFPIMYALVEAELLWHDEDWYFDLIGTGFVEQNISFNKAKKYRLFRQLGTFFDLPDAGLARSQVRQEQIGAIIKLAKSSSKISFSYYDTVIPKKIDKLDGVKYIKEYKKFGQEMSKRPLIEIC